MNRHEILQVAKPILFNTEMVRATLDGRKTATRRINKNFIPQEAEWGYTAFTPKGCISCRGYFESGYGEKFYKLPYQVGDILYVPETWGCYEKDWSDANYFVYKADYPDGAKGYWYEPEQINWCDLPKWRPSIHMPKDAARIFLKVTDIRCERLQGILCSGMQKEGCIPKTVKGGQWEQWQRDYFKPLWDSTIKKIEIGKYGWEANPWVWAYEFEKVVAE